jgi:hypothetical protein
MRDLLDGQLDREAPMHNLDSICTDANVVVERRRLRGAEGGIEATLTPLDGDRFKIVVDPEPPGGWDRIDPAVRADLERQRHRFRVAHELGHTLFYDRSAGRPRRRVAVTRREEAFCDRFAQALLLPDGAVAKCAPSPGEVLRIQREYDVSLETCVRAFADMHGGVFFGLLVSKGAKRPVRAATMGVGDRPSSALVGG